jgi:hypothetical protein
MVCERECEGLEGTRDVQNKDAVEWRVNANVRGWKERGTPNYLLGETEESNISLKSSTRCTPLEPWAIPVMKQE